MLKHIESILDARTIEDAWQSYIRPLNALGFPHLIYIGHRLIGTMNQWIFDEERD